MGKINAYDKIMTENQEKENMEITFFNINLHLTDGLQMKSTACEGELMPERAITSFTVCDT